MTTQHIEVDRDAFIATALDVWEMREKNSLRANEKTAEGDRIVEHWARQGKAADLLEPLLEHSSPEVRFAAAAHLLKHGMADRAALVLKELARNPKGFVAPLAGLVLRQWNRQADAQHE